ncbi:hypothetical protein KI387_020393, partial [Taxus chinensis]
MSGSGSGSVKEGAARAVLKDVWRQGHESVELRQDGKRVIFFCRLCSTRCYSDSALSDHLNGNLHARRWQSSSSSAAIASSPWPFNDGLVFLFPSSKPSTSAHHHTNTNPFPLHWIGCAHVYMRLLHSASTPLVKAVAVWCCWLGEKDATTTDTESDYALVSFPYTHTLGRGGGGGALPNTNNTKSASKIRKKRGRPSKSNSHSQSLSEVEVEVGGAAHRDMDIEKEGEEDEEVEVQAEVEVGSSSNERDVINRGRGRLRSMSNRALRRAFTRQRLKALERLCFICHQQMLPGKDVAALVNRKSGLIACSSRNRRGSFHVFHTTCLIDWILLCESKIWLSQFNGGKVPRKGRWSVSEQRRKQMNKVKSSSSSSNCGSVFCPECQGTGLKTRAGQLEVPRYRLAQVFDWILELIQSRKSWIDHPEQLQECATGLLFCPTDNSQ